MESNGVGPTDGGGVMSAGVDLVGVDFLLDGVVTNNEFLFFLKVERKGYILSVVLIGEYLKNK